MAPIKTTHVGSLPRPNEMIAKFLRKEEITTEELERHVAEIIEKQITLGLTQINNGELPRDDYISATVHRIAGFSGSGTAPIPKDMEDLPELSRRFSNRNALITLNPKAPVKLPACTRLLSYTGTASLLQELDMMTNVYRKLSAKHSKENHELFQTSPSPGTVALFMENQYYTSYESYLESIAAILMQEYNIIANSGCLLQVDCPDLAMGRHTRFSHLSDRDFQKLIALHVEVLNHSLSRIDPGQCRVHICWGNYAGTHHRDIELKKIISQIMSIKARYISIEASNHRHAHEWKLFEEFKIPEDKILMPGVIDTSSNIVEHPDLVAQRILNYVNLLGSEGVVACTDCGFATTASAASVSGEVAWLKLASLVEGSRRVKSQ